MEEPNRARLRLVLGDFFQYEDWESADAGAPLGIGSLHRSVWRRVPKTEHPSAEVLLVNSTGFDDEIMAGVARRKR